MPTEILEAYENRIRNELLHDIILGIEEEDYCRLEKCPYHDRCIGECRVTWEAEQIITNWLRGLKKDD